MNDWINDKGAYRIAPATPGLLIIIITLSGQALTVKKDWILIQEVFCEMGGQFIMVGLSLPHHPTYIRLARYLQTIFTWEMFRVETIRLLKK